MKIKHEHVVAPPSMANDASECGNIPVDNHWSLPQNLCFFVLVKVYEMKQELTRHDTNARHDKQEKNSDFDEILAKMLL